jgi:L-iditol 2-dehydrogenase
MKRAYITAPNKVKISEEARPTIMASQMLVKIAYCGICTLEQRLYEGSRTIFYPIVAGHEASGTIEEIGSQVVTNHALHDRVVLDLVNRCHSCTPCLSGSSNLCENRGRDNSNLLGAFAEYRVVDPLQVFAIPDSLTLREATFCEPLACCIRSINKTRVVLGDTLLVIGCGTMGMLHAKLALARGLRVLVSDIDEQRLAFARALGVDGAFNASDTEQCIQNLKDFTQGRGVEACILTSPSKLAAFLAFRVLAPGGRVNVFTSYDEKPDFPIDMNTLHRNEYQITGSEGRSEFDFAQAVSVLSYKKIQTEDLISNIYPLADIDKALQEACQSDTYRILVQVGEI